MTAGLIFYPMADFLCFLKWFVYVKVYCLIPQEIKKVGVCADKVQWFSNENGHGPGLAEFLIQRR